MARYLRKNGLGRKQLGVPSSNEGIKTPVWQCLPTVFSATLLPVAFRRIQSESVDTPFSGFNVISLYIASCSVRSAWQSGEEGRTDLTKVRCRQTCKAATCVENSADWHDWPRLRRDKHPRLEKTSVQRESTGTRTKTKILRLKNRK